MMLSHSHEVEGALGEDGGRGRRGGGKVGGGDSMQSWRVRGRASFRLEKRLNFSINPRKLSIFPLTNVTIM